MLEVSCEHCSAVLSIPEQYAGQRGRCKHCGGSVLVPARADGESGERSPAVYYSGPVVHGSPKPAASSSAETDSEESIEITAEEVHPLITPLRAEFERLLVAADFEVKMLMSKGKEMQGVMRLVEVQYALSQLHATLTDLYMPLYYSRDALSFCRSERLRQLGHPPVPLYEFVKSQANEDELARYFEQMAYLGYDQEHWCLVSHMVGEVKYMLDTLETLIEPDYVPFDSSAGEGAESEFSVQSRYIPRSVKLSVWRRDQGRCVKCGAKENLVYDHAVPTSMGGTSTEENVQLLCQKCSREKSTGAD